MRVTYGQNWSAYNAAQTVEKERVAALLHGLCSAIDNPTHENGRPSLPLSDKVFCADYEGVRWDLRRDEQWSICKSMPRNGYIDKAPPLQQHPRRSFEETRPLTLMLKAMIEESARPLRAIEERLCRGFVRVL